MFYLLWEKWEPVFISINPIIGKMYYHVTEFGHTSALIPIISDHKKLSSGWGSLLCTLNGTWAKQRI